MSRDRGGASPPGSEADVLRRVGDAVSGLPLVGTLAGTARDWPAHYWSAFVDGGLASVARATGGPRWTQISVGLPDGSRDPALYAGLLSASEQLVSSGLADCYFFLHKPPGLRWRLHAPADDLLPALRTAGLTAARELARPRLRATPGIYEPQRALFGGDRAMAHVHDTWTADSRLWLRWHAARPPGGHFPAPGSWQLSFAVLAFLFRRLGIQGWEDREVWSLIREEAGRDLAPREWSRPDVVQLARTVRESWTQAWQAALRDAPPALSHPLARRLVQDFRAEAGPVAARWYQDCLVRPDGATGPGPRRVAAYWTVFHWNRASFPGTRQALTAQALSAAP